MIDSLLQKKCIRLICNAYPLEHTEKLFKQQNVLMVKDIFLFKSLDLYHKFKTNQLPPYLQNMFFYNTDEVGYFIRSQQHKILKEYFFRLRSNDKSIRYHLPVIINN